MTSENTDDTGSAGDEAGPPSVDEIRHASRVARGYLAPLTDEQAAALDTRPVTERTVDDFRHVRRQNRI
ncbi:Uncharacterised protein [Mycobacterium tuberculosis]|nr:Uncharacterised protein [Mycobacterium tuberculosis]